MRRKLILFFVTAVLSLAGMEMFLRWYNPFPDYSDISIGAFPDGYDSQYGYRGLPHLVKEFILPDYSIMISNNALGYRDREWPLEKTQKRIVVLGDSFAWGWGVNQQETFSSLLDASLSTAEVLNMSYPGYSTDQEFLVLQHEAIRYQPDVVIVQFCENDITDGNGTNRLHGQQPKPRFMVARDRLQLKDVPVFYDRPFWARKQAWADWYGPYAFEKHLNAAGRPPPDRLFAKARPSWKQFHLAHLLRSAMTGVALKLGSCHRPAKPDRKQGPLPSQYSNELEVTTRILEEMHVYCRQRGIELVVVLVPSEFDDVMESTLRRDGIPCLNLGPALSSSFRPVRFWRDPHWNIRGHERAAEAIRSFLETEMHFTD